MKIRVAIGCFKSDITIIDSTSLNSDLFQEVDDIMAFIKKHLKIEYIITGEPQRTERFDYPLDAIREIVINMVVHRDYRDSSASIIKIFDDRIEFYNPGKLYDEITVQDLLSGNYTSKSRNKLIAKIFKEVGMIERYGSGIMRVRKICKDYGVKEPNFYEMHNGFQVVLYNEKIIVAENVTVNNENVTVNNENVTVNEGNVTVNNENVTVNNENVTVNEGNVTVNEGNVTVNEEKVIVNEEKVIVKMTQNQQFILNCIAENPYITIEDLSLIIGISNRKTAANIQKLKAKGLIERVGADKNGYWKIKNC